ncbi:MAG: transglutaminase domain-containing protein [Bacteroidota bacterium]
MKYDALLRKVCFFGIAALSITASAQSKKCIESHNQNPVLKKHKDYEAVIIEDLGKIRFEENQANGGFDFIFERTTTTKIYSNTGLDRAEIEIPLYHQGRDKETLLYVKAAVFHEDDGKEIHFDDSNLDIYDEVYSERIVLKKFAIPNVKEGSVIQVSYGYRSPYKFNLRDWVFQDEVPVLHSKLEVSIIPFYEYSLIKRGSRPLSSRYHVDSPKVKNYGLTEYRERTHVFLMTDVPAFEDESFITNRKDYIDRLEFQLARITRTNGIQIDIMSDWPTTCKDLIDHKDFGKYLNAAKKQSKSMIALCGLKGMEKAEAVDQIVAYIKENYKWNGSQGKFASKKVKEFLEDKEGEASDINLFLVGMLNAAGIEAYPVLLSTRAHGKVYKDTPMHTHFNYVIAYIPHRSGYMLRDATDIHYPNDQLPLKCINDLGLVVDKENEKWVDLGENNSSSSICKYTSLSIDPSSSTASLQIEMNSSGYDAVNHNRQIGINPDDAKEYFENDLISDPDSVLFLYSSVTCDSFGIKLFTDVPLEVVGSHIFLHPFAELTEKECPLKSKTRSYPVDMVYQRSRHYQTEFNIPEGYTLSHLPDPYLIDNDIIQISYVPDVGDDGMVRIQADLVFKKRVYPPKDYKKLRVFYAESVKRFNEKISFEEDVAGSIAGIRDTH